MKRYYLFWHVTLLLGNELINKYLCFFHLLGWVQAPQLFKDPRRCAVPSFCLQISAHMSPSAPNSLFVLLHLAISYSLFKMKIRQHFLQEACPDASHRDWCHPPCFHHSHTTLFPSTYHTLYWNGLFWCVSSTRLPVPCSSLHPPTLAQSLAQSRWSVIL